MMKTKIKPEILSFNALAFIAVLLINSACNKPDISKDVPHCVKAKIKHICKQPMFNPPAEVWEIKANGQTFYYFTSDCCDQFNYMYDNKCNVVCAPDGGFSGGGDGKCPDFGGKETRTLIWKDDRQ